MLESPSNSKFKLPEQEEKEIWKLKLLDLLDSQWKRRIKTHQKERRFFSCLKKKVVKNVLHPLNTKNRTQFSILSLTGPYRVDVTYDGEPVKGSPFVVDAIVPADPSKVRAYGPGLKEGTVGKPAPFTIETIDAGLWLFCRKSWFVLLLGKCGYNFFTFSAKNYRRKSFSVRFKKPFRTFVDLLRPLCW